MSACIQGSIVQNSRAAAQYVGPKLTSALVVVDMSSGTILSPLSIAAMAVSHHLGKMLSNSGVQVHHVGVAQAQLEPKAVIDEAIQKERPTHLLMINVPSATVVNGAQTKQYNLRARVFDAVTKKEVWSYSADVANGPGMRSEDVAVNIFSRMRLDGIL